MVYLTDIVARRSSTYLDILFARPLDFLHAGEIPGGQYLARHAWISRGHQSSSSRRTRSKPESGTLCSQVSRLRRKCIALFQRPFNIGAFVVVVK